MARTSINHRDELRERPNQPAPTRSNAGTSEGVMEPYIVRDGDYLLKLAYQFGFDADTVWSDPANADLQTLRQDPNILFPGDILQIPDQNSPPPPQSVTTGTTNNFTADTQTTTITIQITDQSFASQPYTVQELPELTGLTSGADGTVSMEAHVDVQAVRYRAPT
jgi:hypothetical protein